MDRCVIAVPGAAQKEIFRAGTWKYIKEKENAGMPALRRAGARQSQKLNIPGLPQFYWGASPFSFLVSRLRTRPAVSHALGYRDFLSRFQAHSPRHILALSYSYQLSPGTPHAHDRHVSDTDRHVGRQSIEGRPNERVQLCTCTHGSTAVSHLPGVPNSDSSLVSPVGTICAILCTTADEV
jgi:hypothetical protein